MPTALLILLVVLFLLGSLLAARPSRHFVRLSHLRNAAIGRGLRVCILSEPGLPLLQKQVAYCLDLPIASRSQPWRLTASGRLNAVWPGPDGPPPVPLHLAGWLEEGRVPTLSTPQQQQLAALLQDLPDCTDAIGTTGRSAFVIWAEKDADKLDAVDALLRFVARFVASAGSAAGKHGGGAG